MARRDTGLKLKAGDGEDFQVLSAMLQDALVPIGDMTYFPAEARFVMVVNRFRWENDKGPDPAVALETGAHGDAPFLEDERDGADQRHERVLASLAFDGVSAVRLRGIDRKRRDRILDLLSIAYQPDAVILEMAGGAAIRLEGGAIVCHLEDRGLPWPTVWRPSHAASDETKGG